MKKLLISALLATAAFHASAFENFHTATSGHTPVFKRIGDHPFSVLRSNALVEVKSLYGHWCYIEFEDSLAGLSSGWVFCNTLKHTQSHSKKILIREILTTLSHSDEKLTHNLSRCLEQGLVARIEKNDLLDTLQISYDISLPDTCNLAVVTHPINSDAYLHYRANGKNDPFCCSSADDYYREAFIAFAAGLHNAIRMQESHELVDIEGTSP